MGKLLSLEETADLLGVSKQTLRNWDKNGKLKADRTEGNQRRYNESTILKLQKVKDNGLLFKKLNGEKWYLRDFDFFPEPISDRAPWIYDEEVLRCFKQNHFKWFDTYDECAKACLDIRRQLGIAKIDDEDWLFTTRKQAFKDAGYQVD